MDFKDEELSRMNVIKDKRRRYLYVVKDKHAGYQLTERTLKYMNFYSNRLMVLLMVFLILFSLLHVDFLILLLILAALYGIIELVVHKWFLPRLNVIKISEDDYQKLSSLEAERLKEQDRFTHAIVALLLAFILVSATFDGTTTYMFAFEVYLMYTVASLLGAYSIYGFIRYFKNRKLYKNK